jgi:hypothetical protein
MVTLGFIGGDVREQHKIPMRLVESRPSGAGVVNMIYAPAMVDGRCGLSG